MHLARDPLAAIAIVMLALVLPKVAIANDHEKKSHPCPGGISFGGRSRRDRGYRVAHAINADKTIVMKIYCYSIRDGSPASTNSIKAYRLETSIYQRLTETTPPTDCKGQYFPKLLARDDDRLAFNTSYGGVPLDYLGDVKGWESGFCALSWDEVLHQGICMDAIMSKARVQHFDMHDSGKNMLLNGKQLTLYDFDAAELDGVADTPENKALEKGHNGLRGSSIGLLSSLYKRHCLPEFGNLLAIYLNATERYRDGSRKKKKKKN